MGFIGDRLTTTDNDVIDAIFDTEFLTNVTRKVE